MFVVRTRDPPHPLPVICPRLALDGEDEAGFKIERTSQAGRGHSPRPRCVKSIGGALSLLDVTANPTP